LWPLLLFLSSALTEGSEIVVSPQAVILDSPERAQQLLVSDPLSGERSVDRTREANYRVLDASIATISPGGLIRPQQDGETEIHVSHGKTTLRVPVTIRGVASPRPVSFAQEIIPILTKASCNSGGCHGKAEGQNGFKLSVFGYDTRLDHDSLVKNGRGRRIVIASPDDSLMLLKGTARVPHGGGRQFQRDSHRYRLLRRWIAEGASYESGHYAPVVAVEVEPKRISLTAGGNQQLRVTAIDSEGHRYCVTTEAAYESNTETIATIDGRGLIQAAEIPGEAAMVVSYMGYVDVCRVTLPREGVHFMRPPEQNFVDKHGWDQLKRLGIIPSGLSDDGMFLRRVSLDTIGTLPSVAEARDFLTSNAANKRATLIDTLLERPEYADYWAMLWADILRVDQGVVQPQGAVAMTRWLRRQFAENRPYDQFVREIMIARGSTTAEGPAAFYRAVKKPDQLSRSISQLFLGVRIECAQCHHHPSERWRQEDYYAFAGFFTGLKQKTLPTGVIAVRPVAGKDLNHPRTGKPVPTAALGADVADFSGRRDRRAVLAEWMVQAENPFFAKTIVNRIWAHYFGRGLIEPIDDIRTTNPASNEPLLAALEVHLRDLNYDLKAFTKTLLNSRLYQLSSKTNDSNADDLQNFSHAAFKPLPAEVLLGAINRTTGTEEKFIGWPRGYRAIQVWDNRMPSYFFRVFGRPLRMSVCQCERGNEPSIAQALHLMNSPEVSAKIQDRTGRARAIAMSGQQSSEMIETLYLAALSRFPTPGEQKIMAQAFENSTSNSPLAVEDIMWTLLNTKEFIYNH
jgi:hypothetical protein